jgi:hypothetical protein
MHPENNHLPNLLGKMAIILFNPFRIFQEPGAPRMLSSQSHTSKKAFFVSPAIVYGVAILIPCAFYLLLARANVNLPILDDYDSILGFLNYYSQLPSLGQKMLYTITAQHNEYKLIFEHIVLLGEYGLLGHANFALLNVIGGISVLLLAVVLWNMFLPDTQDRLRRLTLFLPVILLLFQLQYYSNLTWATTALQNVPVIAFSFASLYFLLQGKKGSTMGCALILLVLACCTSGNGLILIPVGLFMSAWQRRWRTAVIWICASTVILVGYFFHYVSPASNMGKHESLFTKILHFDLPYFLSFLGSAVENEHRFPVRGAAIVLGAAVVICIVYAWYRGYYRRNPSLAAACIFILITAFGVASIRADLGIAQSLTSRYHIYSDLLLIMIYIFFVDEFLQRSIDTARGRQTYAIVLLGAFGFCLVSNLIGYRSLIKRRNQALTGMRLYLHPTFPGSTESPVLFTPEDEINEPRIRQFSIRARSVLDRSRQLDIYQPPDPQ